MIASRTDKYEITPDLRNNKMTCIWNCQRAVLRRFFNFGHFLARHPFIFLVTPLVICAALASGFFFVNKETDIEVLYTPMNSRAVKDRELMTRTFPDLSGSIYNRLSLNRLEPYIVIIFRSVEDREVLTPHVLDEVERLYKKLYLISVQEEGKIFSFIDLCARRDFNCVIEASFIFGKQFRKMLNDHKVTYPYWRTPKGPVDLSHFISDVNLTESGTLISAGSLKLMLPLRQDSPEMERLSKMWERQFLKFIKEVNTSSVEFVYSASQALNQELDKTTKGDIFYFSLTFTLMITYACLVSSGGDCVSTRALLAYSGVIGVLFGIMGALGVVTYCGVEFVNIVGCMPFLILGIGVDDMFLLMSSWSETLSMTELSLPDRMGTVFKKAGIGITITSVTDFLAFAIGTTSTFKSVRNFCIFTGVAVILCYVCNVCVFGASLTLHGRRVYTGRHTLTCQKVTKSRNDLRKEGGSCLYVFLCGGHIPVSADEEQSMLEKGPRKILVKFLMWQPVRVGTFLVFAAYLAVAIWGCTQVKQGLELKDLVLESSHFYKYQEWERQDFGVKIPVSFVTTTTQDYGSNETLQEMVNLLQEARKDPLINPHFDVCWLTILAGTPLYDTSSLDNFTAGLERFLNLQPQFKNDVVFGADNQTIIASRCYVISHTIATSNDEASLMTRMRQIADNSPVDVLAYSPAFVFYEQYVEILPATLQTVGATLAVMFVATCLFLPHPLMVAIVMVQVVMIITGIIGFMTLWGLTISSVTMIHLIMSVGFSVDFCAHVCTAYMISDQETREGRARDAIIHASSPIFNSGMSSLVGVFVLLFTESYIFQSFFKIMVLVIGFGILHAAVLVPIVLSFIGPSFRVKLEDSSPESPSLLKTSNV